MNKWLVGILLFISVSVFGNQNEYRIAILDFEVMTTRDDYRFIGKGLAEVLSFELGNEKSLVIIERSERNSILQEINFSLTGLSDTQASLDVGRLLTANFMVVGEVIGIDRQFLVTLKLLDVETGAIVWQEQVRSRLNNYESGSRFFAKSLISALAADEPTPDSSRFAETLVSGESEDNRSESLAAFSTAINAIDEGNNDKTRVELS